MPSTEAPFRSRASSSNLRAWPSSASLLGTGSEDTGHQRKAAGPWAASRRVDVRETRAYSVHYSCSIGASTIQRTIMTEMAIQVRGRQQGAPDDVGS